MLLRLFWCPILSFSYSRHINPFQNHGKISTAHHNGVFRMIPNRLYPESTTLQPPRKQTKPTMIPPEYFDSIDSPIEKHK